MKITPLEIRQKTFEKIFRGYDKDEVNAYLQSLSMEWERMLEENKKLELKIENLVEEVNKLRDLESSLFKTLKTAVYAHSICHNCYEKHVKPELDKFQEA